MSETPSSMNGTPSGDESSGPRICGAKTRNGGICAKPAMPNGKCANHGGKSVSGLKAPSFRTGRYSKAIKKLGEDIGDRVNDPSLLDPRRSIAIQETITARLSEMLEDNDSPEFRVNALRKLREAIPLLRTDPPEAVRLLKELDRYLERGVSQSSVLMAVGESAERLNRQQIRYWQTAMTASRAIAPDEFFALLFRLGKILEEDVGKDAARGALIRVDREVCGGHLGLAKPGA